MSKIVFVALAIAIIFMIGDDLAQLRVSRLPGLECGPPIYARDANMHVRVLFDQAAGWNESFPAQSTDMTGAVDIVPMGHWYGTRPEPRVAMAFTGQSKRPLDNQRIVCVARAAHRVKY